jgi:secreted PhoX family phosphatase
MTDRSDFRMEHDEDIGSNPTTNLPFSEIAEARLSRRGALQGLLATAGIAALGSALAGSNDAAAAGADGSSFTFKPLKHGEGLSHNVAEGYEVDVLIRWGDKVVAGAPEFDVTKQTAAAQELQFGYNNDFVGYLPFPDGRGRANHGLLWVNHEYTNTNLMFPGLGAGQESSLKASKEQADIEIAAHGGSVIEIRKDGGKWKVVENSKYGRRITATTPISISGPARGHAKLKTSADPSGSLVLGMLNNCAGGITPWGTVLTAEENFNQYFGNAPDTPAYKRYGIGKNSSYAWSKYHDRFDAAKEPNESNRFGYLVEIDPFDPSSAPVKRTAIGRFKHEGSSTVVNKDGHVVVYSGDDERFDYVYKFVTKGKYDAKNRRNNLGLLDEGTLYVAKFSDDGSLEWLPLIQGQGPLTAANGFASQADVCIETRRAADLVGATPMDRPEDVDTNPVTGVVYMACTNNSNRKPEQVNKANPRPDNRHGHIIEIIAPGTNAKDRDHTATKYTWSMFMLCGDTKTHGGKYNPGTDPGQWISCPDNVAFDSKGRIWIGTDGAPTAAKTADGIYAADVTGKGRALPKLFFQCPQDAEICGPWFAPDDASFFVGIQHPGESNRSTYDEPSTRWPDFKAGVPPRPAVIVITKKGGGPLGA